MIQIDVHIIKPHSLRRRATSDELYIYFGTNKNSKYLVAAVETAASLSPDAFLFFTKRSFVTGDLSSLERERREKEFRSAIGLLSITMEHITGHSILILRTRVTFHPFG